ncbi:MAG: Txe/YoeB family addiction module toxin [Flavobacteriales bacterium]|jgi:toxin YoeB
MAYSLDFSRQAKSEIDFYKKSGNKPVLKKLLVLLKEISDHPYQGTGKPEALRHELTGLWSRRINREHRIVYEVKEDSVLIHSVSGHYE